MSPGQTSLTLNCIRTQLQFPVLQQFKVLADLTPQEPHAKTLSPHFPCYTCVYVSNLCRSNKASKREPLIALQGDFLVPFSFGHLRIFFEKYSTIYMHRIRRKDNSFFQVYLFDPCSSSLLRQFCSTLWSFLEILLLSLPQTVVREHTSCMGVSVLPVFTVNSQLHNIKHKSKLSFPIGLYKRAEHSQLFKPLHNTFNLEQRESACFESYFSLKGSTKSFVLGKYFIQIMLSSRNNSFYINSLYIYSGRNGLYKTSGSSQMLSWFLRYPQQIKKKIITLVALLWIYTMFGSFALLLYYV